MNSQVQPHCKNCRLAPALGEHALAELEAMARPGKLLQKGDFLFRQGDPFDSLFLLRSGSAKAFTTNEHGLEKITGFHFASEIFGFSGLGEGVYPVSAQALETTLYSPIPFGPLERFAVEHPGLSQQIMLLMSRKIREDQQMMLLLSRLNADSRMAAFFLAISAHQRERGFSALRFRLPMSRHEIADYLGMAVETVSRTLARLQASSLLNVAGREVEILDFVELCELAGGELER